jgi:putative phage-type endonuclease
MTPELRELRLGKLTASKAAVIMGDLKTEGLKRYVRQLAGERLFGDLGDEGFRSAAMDRGNEVESDALDWYCWEVDQLIERGPHIDHPIIPYIAATPDGIIRGVRVIEAKSPLFTTWAEIKERNEVPSEYRWQTRWQLMCCALSECHFVAWHPCPGGLIIPCTVTESECAQMAERAALVEARIRQTMEIISERKAA